MVFVHSSFGSVLLIPHLCVNESKSDTCQAGPNYHPLGTGAMMARALGGVTSPQLKVYGTTNLRVVDASAIPLQNSGHLMSTLYALVERAADMILGKWYKS